MPAVIPKISFPIPSNEQGQAFADSDALLNALVKESSGQYLVGSQGMWHGGIHITDATAPWCALSARTEAEQQYRSEPYKGAQFIRCMADGEIVAYRVDKAYPSIPWRDESLYFSTSFVLVKHDVQPGENATSGLTFYTLYMNLAPFSAYAQLGDERERKTADRLSYYRSAEDVQTGSSAKAGTLPVGVRVTLGDKLIACDSPRGRRQFGEVRVTEEVQDAAGVTLSAGTAIWILCDRGNLKAGSSASSLPPSWWAKCALAYSVQPVGVVQCKARTNWSYYLSSEDVLQSKVEGRLTADFPLSYEPGNATQQVVRPSDSRTFSLMTLGKDVGKQKKGDRVWVVSDGDSLIPLTPAGSGEPKFGEVVQASPVVKINAGDSIGHMGFYQLPEENSKHSRYQVHIECLSMDDKLPTFLTNPDEVGESTPFYLKYPEGAALFIKNAQGAMVDSTRKTLARGIVTLSKVPVVEQDGQPTHYQIHKENGYLAAADVQKLSQYALGELGFVTLDKAPESFDLIDGVKHPDNVVKGILEQMYKAAEAETRTSHILNKYNYKRLLDKIDSNQDGHYSEQEYLQAVHDVSPSYRDALYRIIVKHGSEWYYGKDDPLWKTYLDKLTTDAPLWKTYTEAFIDKITWMKQVAGMGSEPWHMHPVVFLGAFKTQEHWFDIEKFIVKYKEQHSDIFGFYDRGNKISIPQLNQESEGALRDLLTEMRSQYYNYFDSFNEKFVSYMLATVRIESYDFRRAVFFKPISERISYEKAERDYGSGATAENRERAVLNHNRSDGDGYKYRGRGLIQLTWKINYEKFMRVTGIDIVNNPDACLEINTAVSIMMKGMRDGEFRGGNSLDVYLGEGRNDYYNARLIINGYSNGIPDKADEFKDYAELFEVIINEIF
ncbi:MAG: hypothetical protein WAU54_20465 [Chania sp.]